MTPEEYLKENLRRRVLNYLWDFAYLTAWREDMSAEENIKLMKDLKDDLIALNHKAPCQIDPDDKPLPCLMYWRGVLRPMYCVHGHNDVKDYIILSRKYGQTTLICHGGAYDVASGKRIGDILNKADVYRDTKQQPQHPRWIYVGLNTYIMLYCTKSIDMYDTLNAWSSGNVTPRDGNVD